MALLVGEEFWGTVNIQATIEVVETSLFTRRRSQGDFQFLLTSVSRRLDDPDHDFGEFYLTGSSQNYGRVSDPQLDALYQSQSESLYLSVRAALRVYRLKRLQGESIG